MSDLPEPAEPIFGIFTPIGAAEIQPPIFVIDKLLPVGLTFLAGPPKLSKKSTLALAMAILVAGKRCNALPPDLSMVVRGGPVLGLSLEATAGELRYAAEIGFGVKFDPLDETLLIADDPFAFRLDDPDAVERLLFWLAERDPRLLIIDPLAELHSAEEKDAGAMIRLLRPLRKWAVAHESAVLCVHHTRKPMDPTQQKYDPLDMRGSSAIFGKADGALIVSPQEGSNLLIKAVFKRAGGWERTITLGAWGEGGPEPLTVTDRSVLDCCNGATIDQIGPVCALSKSTVTRSLNKLVQQGKVTCREGKWYKVMP